MRTGLLASTLTPGNTPPDASLATPAMPAVVCWASAAAGIASAPTTPRIRTSRYGRTIRDPLESRDEDRWTALTGMRDMKTTANTANRLCKIRGDPNIRYLDCQGAPSV